jgi:2-iminoacetate synthase ThiH
LEREVSEVHFHPRKDESPAQAVEQLVRLRAQFPQARLHGFSPGWLQRHGWNRLDELQQAGLDSLCWFTGELTESHPAASGWEQCADLAIAKVACFVYGPHPDPADLEKRVRALVGADQIVPLPRAVGDLVVIPGATTDGTCDIEVLSRCRALAQPKQRVRASWGALGFKLAQSSLVFGSDALAGWGLEEQLAYSGRMRPADLIGWDEARAGVVEAGMEPL